MKSGSVAPEQHKAVKQTGELSFWSANYLCSLSFGFSHRGPFCKEIFFIKWEKSQPVSQMSYCDLNHLYKSYITKQTKTNAQK